MRDAGLGGSRVWRRAVKRAGKLSYWQKVGGLHPDFYRPEEHFRILRMHVTDTHALLLTPAGEVVAGLVGAIFPIIGTALAAITVALREEEADLLAAELIRADLAACQDDWDECPEQFEALWWTEQFYGTTMTPGAATRMTPEAAAILQRYLQDGGDVARVGRYLTELFSRRKKTQLDDAAGATRLSSVV